jgi:hypothetical protein
MTGADLSAEVATKETYVVPAIGEKKFTVAAVDLGIKGMTPHRMAERGIEVHVLPATATVEDVRRQPDGVFFSNGPATRPPPTTQVAVMQAVLERGPALRHLLRQPDPRPRARLRHLQAEVRPPGHQPARAGPHDRQGRGHRAQPRLRRRRAARQGLRDAVRPRRGLARLPQRPRRRGAAAARPAGVLVQYHPEAAAGPARRRLPVRPLRVFDGGPAMPKRTDIQSVLVIGSGPIVIGQAASSTTPAPRPAGCCAPRASGSSWSTPTRRRS